MSYRYSERIEQWRARKWAKGLCGQCGKNPLGTNKRTGEELIYCRPCSDRRVQRQLVARRKQAA